MNFLVPLAVLSGLASYMPSDTIDLATLRAAPVMDGRVADREYGERPLRIPTAAGEVRVWIARHDGFVYIAAILPDSSFYWGDDFVVSLDPNGSADATPQEGDRQWYLRRTLDSSVVSFAIAGRWNTPGQEPPALGPKRHDADWDVASASSATTWIVELRIRDSVMSAPAGALPRIAFRTYNSAPSGWWSWPEPPDGTPAQRVERSPALWTPIRLTR